MGRVRDSGAITRTGGVVNVTVRPPPRFSLLVALCLAALACRRSPAPRGDASFAGMTTVDPSATPARRVVSLVPSATEVIFALGAGDRVVGVSVFDDYPPAVTRLPRVGGMVNPSYEAIEALRPDALVGVQGPLDLSTLQRLQSRGVRVLFPRVESLDELLASLELFGRLLGRVREAAALRTSLREGLDRVARSVAGRRRPRVLAVFATRPLVVAGRGSWFDELLVVAGGDNVARAGTRYPSVSLEQVIAWAPEVIFDLSFHGGGADLSRALSAHGTVPAMRDGRLYVLNDPLYVRPGPRVVTAAQELSRRLFSGRQ